MDLLALEKLLTEVAKRLVGSAVSDIDVQIIDALKEFHELKKARLAPKKPSGEFTHFNEGRWGRPYVKSVHVQVLCIDYQTRERGVWVVDKTIYLDAKLTTALGVMMAEKVKNLKRENAQLRVDEDECDES